MANVAGLVSVTRLVIDQGYLHEDVGALAYRAPTLQAREFNRIKAEKMSELAEETRPFIETVQYEMAGVIHTGYFTTLDVARTMINGFTNIQEMHMD